MKEKTPTVSEQRRDSFIQEMNRKWQRKYKAQQAWLDSFENKS